MNTVGLTRKRWSSPEKYRRIDRSRFSARWSTVVGTTLGWTPSGTTSVAKNRWITPSSGSSSSPRWSPTTRSGRSTSTLWYLSVCPLIPDTSPDESTTMKSAPSCLACSCKRGDAADHRQEVALRRRRADEVQRVGRRERLGLEILRASNDLQRDRRRRPHGLLTDIRVQDRRGPARRERSRQELARQRGLPGIHAADQEHRVLRSHRLVDERLVLVHIRLRVPPPRRPVARVRASIRPGRPLARTAVSRWSRWSSWALGSAHAFEPCLWSGCDRSRWRSS